VLDGPRRYERWLTLMNRSKHEIERRPLPTPSEWLQSYAGRPGTPVIFTGVVERWPAYERWTFEGFRGTHGAVPVSVREYVAGAFAERTKPLGDFLQDMSSFHGYVANVDLGRQIPSLAADCPFRLIWWQKLSERQYWIGPAGTVSTLHRDF